MRIAAILPSLLLLACLRLAAQQPRVESLTIANGLSQGMIYDIEQTDDGFLWFATKDGLNRYDGYQFKVFTNDPFNPFSIAGNDILHLFEDSRGNLWASTPGNVDVLEKKTGKFFHLPLNTGKAVTTGIHYLAEGTDSSIWIGVSDGLLRLKWKERLQFDNPDLKASMNPEHVSLCEPLSETQVTTLFVQSDGTLLAAIEGDGVYIVDPSTGKCRLLLPTPMRIDRPEYVESKPGRVWIKLDKRVFLYEKGSPPREIPLAKPSDRFRLTHVVTDGMGNLIWSYGSFTDGSFLYSAREEDLVSGNGNASAQLIYKCETFSPSFELDRSGNVWVGTNGYGVQKIHLFRPPFQHLIAGMSIQRILKKGGELYFTIYDRGGCFRLDKVTETGASTNEFPDGCYIYNLCNPKKSDTWFFTGVYPGDQYFLGIRRAGSTEYRNIPPVNQFSPMREDARGRLWAGVEGSRLMCILPDNESIIYYDLPAQLGDGARVHDLYFDKAQHLWIGTTNGIVKIKPGEITPPTPPAKSLAVTNLALPAPVVFQTQAANPNSLRHNFVTAFCPDPLEPERYLWVSTKGGGLNLLDLTTAGKSGQAAEFQHFTNQNSGLPNDVVYGILPDDLGSLWMSTNRGLSRLRVGKNREYTFRNFREFDGLQSDEFNTGALVKGNDGRLYFGGVNGLTAFYPAEITERISDAAVLITGLKINNLQINHQGGDGILTQPVHLTKSITLRHSQNLVTLEFALMDFTNTQENRFRYRLSGADPDWVEAGTSHSANYAQLRPGNYTFEVQGSISGGIWNEKTARMSITILSPWWATWWAYAAYVLALGGATYWFYKMRLRQKMEHQEALRLQELDAFKSRFFTNITHEFRTPLTVILGTAEQLLSRESGMAVGSEQWAVGSERPAVKGKLGLIKRNGQNLLRLINQILDLAKLESNSLKINYVQGDLLPYLRYISESLHSLSNAQNVMLKVESSESRIVMDYDPERLLSVVHNLLSNAIKFTPSGGWVTLSAGMRDEGRGMKDSAASSLIPHPSSLILTVADTGVGIPAEDLPRIFDRFYQVESTVSSLRANSTGGGTGIGLSLTKELVKAMGGEISVESEVGKGTMFTVRLPVTNQAAAATGATAPALVGVTPTKPGNVGATLAVAQLAVAQSPADETERPYILLIEDNPDVVEYLTACLGENYRLDFAYNGRAGIEKALEIVPDLILSDVMMPEKDGFEVCDFLKNDERTSHIPIVLLTAKVDVESRITGLKRGADAYLSKPFHQEELSVTLANLLEMRRKLQVKYRDWGLGIGDLALSPIPHPPIPNPRLTRRMNF